MYDPELNEWRRLLQKARAIYKKIKATKDLSEKEKLRCQHKEILNEARRIYNLYQQKNQKMEREISFK